ncbi:head-tail adaptor protein [Staphylococcus hyicus]|uniref:Head-tail adaptor protein n=1 Tax=Staphylococcus delphini TaxID=53344 RepID=A0AAQ0D5L4_9STAP|nr:MULTISPECIES: head-tail adaptor protein [Staphylococcus]MCE5153268.1 head-tail adaptor protein [Staphylococcus hyicus]MDG4944691.1 head-tail adaptor protein [Staphylococcus agnetis]QUM66174.1 head-tail adaptor protein [Staphylococcus delphini]QUM68609.1 head-tail adaptor protein [Staphylococcus delphini]UXR29836.1 head-tail adaptor protein [Staphylococcus simulans]
MKFNSNRLNERVTFCHDTSKSINGLPQKPITEELYSCYACIQDARESDMQTSLTTSSQFIKTIIIRDPRGDYKPNNKHYVIHDGERYQIKYVKKDYQDKSYVRVYCEVVF